MIVIDLHSRVPIYEQIEEQIIWLINTGVYKPDDKLPSIRALATELKLNVNTVKRAFQDLENKNVTYSLPGKGIFVSPRFATDEKVKQEAVAALTVALRSAKAKGLTEGDISLLIKDLFDENEVDNND